VLELLRADGTYQVQAFLDDQQPPGALVQGHPVWGPTSMLNELSVCGVHTVHIAIGNNHVRHALSDSASAAHLTLATVIHSKAFVSSSAVLAPGCAVMAHACIGANARLGRSAIINMGAVVDHEAFVGDCGHLGANATMAGGTSIGARAWLQAGAALGYGIHLPDDATVAPGEGRA